MEQSEINEILELIKINEHYSEKSNSLLSYVTKYLNGGGDLDIEHLVLEENKCRKIAAQAYEDAMAKIESVDTFYSMFRFLMRAIENKDLSKELKIRNLIKKKIDGKNATTN